MDKYKQAQITATVNILRREGVTSQEAFKERYDKSADGSDLRDIGIKRAYIFRWLYNLPPQSWREVTHMPVMAEPKEPIYSGDEVSE